MTTVLLWRHGRTEYNATLRIQGQIDIPLDDVGRWQAATAAPELLRAWTPDVIVSSDLGRAHATAAFAAELCGLPVRLDERLRERHFGEWEGMSGAEISARDPEAYARWRAGGDTAALGTEQRAAVGARMADAINEHAAAAGPDGVVLLVSHGSAISLGTTTVLGQDPEGWRGLEGMANAHWAVLRRAHASHAPGWRLRTYNVGPAVASEDWVEGRGPGGPYAEAEVTAL